MARPGRSYVEHHHRHTRPARPPSLLPALLAGCALFAVAAARVGAGRRLVYNEVDSDAFVAHPPTHRPLSLAVEASVLSASQSALTAARAPCTLTRPTPRRPDELAGRE